MVSTHSPTAKQHVKAAAPVVATDRHALLSILEWMMLSRATEERLIRLYHQGQIQGGVYVGIGQEAISACSVAAGAKQDLYAPCIRNMAIHIGRGETLRNVFRQWLGRVDGPTRGRDGNVHFGNMDHGVYAMISHLGAMISVVTGGVMARRRSGQNCVGFAHVGDGASSTGDFHEAVNFAAVRNVPIVILIENNHYAYSTPTKDQYRCEKLADRAIGYGIDGHSADGNDAASLYPLLQHIVEDIRVNPRPVLVDCDTMRMRGHGEHDDFFYAPKELLEEYGKRDPIAQLRKHLRDNGLLSEGDSVRLEAAVTEQVTAAYKEALEDPLPNPATLMDGVYAGG
ncbi:MAG: thiamine pyrophosphate-dependent dehydrogenase E1 component subunit alpha [Verrucomicrobia bacterium]|nr:thiamine pyrophosphate-dependent dehydrogenase E1 component subunit alpha [Verrucomicrobiota bacterium]